MADSKLGEPIDATADGDEDFDVTLNPMQIRTFVLKKWSFVGGNGSGSSSIHSILAFKILVSIISLIYGLRLF